MLICDGDFSPSLNFFVKKTGITSDFAKRDWYCSKAKLLRSTWPLVCIGFDQQSGWPPKASSFGEPD